MSLFIFFPLYVYLVTFKYLIIASATGLYALGSHVIGLYALGSHATGLYALNRCSCCFLLFMLHGLFNGLVY